MKTSKTPSYRSHGRGQGTSITESTQAPWCTQGEVEPPNNAAQVGVDATSERQEQEQLLTMGVQMPKGTKVDKVFQALKRQGKSPATAAKIAQAATGKSLATGKKPKHKKK